MRTGHSGFTLVEILVALAIVGIVAGSLVKMFITMSIGHTARSTQADLQQSVRAVLDLMSREMRMVGFSSLRPSEFGLIYTGVRELTFTVDWDNDGYVTKSHGNNPYITQESDSISYRMDEQHYSLIRTTSVGTEKESKQSILGGTGDPMRVVDLRFSYFDQRGLPTARKDDIKSVGAAITVDLPAGLKGRQTRVYQTLINCRNLQL